MEYLGQAIYCLEPETKEIEPKGGQFARKKVDMQQLEQVITYAITRIGNWQEDSAVA